MGQDSVPNTQGLVILPNSKFVCDSRHLADLFWRGRHDNAMRDLRKMQSAASTEGTLLKFEEREFRTEDGNRYKKMDFTAEDLSVLCAYSEKLRPQFLRYIKAVRDTEAKQLARLKAQLEALNQKLLEPKSTKPRSPRSSQVALAEKKIAVLETVDGESKLVQKLASSLSLVELARAVAAARDAQATGSRTQARLARKWACAVEDWNDAGCRGSCPDPLEYMNSCEYSGFFQEEDEE